MKKKDARKIGQLKWGKVLIRIVIYLALSEVVSTMVHVVGGILRGEHGKPAFVTPEMSFYSFFVELFMVFAFIILGNSIPIKNKFSRGLLFMLLFWASDYMSQILGMLGGHSPIMDPDAVSFSTLLMDSVGYLIKAILLGLLLSSDTTLPKRVLSGKDFLRAALSSMAIFPMILFILEMTLGMINPQLLSVSSFQIRKEETISFYLVFYLFQAISGFLFAVFYRYSEFNSGHKQKWLVFASTYGWLLWTPVVMIMPFFGIGFAGSLCFALIMLLAIYLDTFLFTRFMKE